MYFERAHLWPIITPVDAYADEMVFWMRAFHDELGGPPASLLDLGSGGGHHLHFLEAGRVVAVDLSEQMLRLCAELNPGVETICADMLAVELPGRFQAITVHDSLTYLTSRQQVIELFLNARRHLQPDGVLLFAPDYFRDHFDGPYTSLTRNCERGLDVTLTHYEYDPDPQDTTFSAHYVSFVRQGSELNIFQEEQCLGLFDREHWFDMAREAGYEVKALPYPVWEGVKESALFVARPA